MENDDKNNSSQNQENEKADTNKIPNLDINMIYNNYGKESNTLKENNNQFEFIELDKILENLQDENKMNGDNPNTVSEENKNEEIKDNLAVSIILNENSNRENNLQVISEENANKIEINTNMNINLNNDANLNMSVNINDNNEKNEIQSPQIKTNLTKNELNYDTLFRSDSLPSSFKNMKKVSLTVEDLKNDDNFLKRSLTAQKDEYIKIEDWNLNIEEIEEDFRIIDNKSIITIIIYLVNQKDLHDLNETIKKCDIYSHLAKSENVTIGPVSTLEYMVESTFGFDKNLINQMTDHIISLEKHIFRWRSILGDGNCYYRAIIFAFLEKVIFDKNILLLKKIILEINQKFDENYPNTRNLSQSNKQEIFNLNKTLILKIFYLIFEILDRNKKDSVQSAYEILIKSLLFCPTFDLGIIIYFRYKIYEFIKANWNKVYTREFSVKLGNLLPSQYETEYGDFLFDKFFEEQLMKLNVDAEKIVIYLTPFVLKLNMKIIIYEFDQNSNVLIRDFPCYLDNKQDVYLLYRKTHYDLVYEGKEFEAHAKELCYYVNLNEDLKVVKNGLLEKIRGKEQEVNLKSSFKDISNSPLQSKEKHNEENINSITTFPNLCVSCKTPYLHKSNIFNLCLNCLNNELKNHLMANYLLLLNESLACYQDENEMNILKIKNEIFNVRQIEFYGKPVTLSRLCQISEKPFQDLIREIKNKICVVCVQNVTANKTFFTLPCGCILCSKQCFDYYFSFVFKKTNSDRNVTLCICGYQFNNHDFKLIYGFLDKSKLKDQKKIIESYVVSNFSRVCIGGCLEDFRYSQKEFHLLKLKDPELTKLYKLKEFKHVICEDCFKVRIIIEKNDIECILCNSTHKVVKIKKNMSQQDDDCNIL